MKDYDTIYITMIMITLVLIVMITIVNPAPPPSLPRPVVRFSHAIWSRPPLPPSATMHV